MAEKHGYRNTPTYNSWMNMKVRCKNPKTHGYHNYGGRGIKVCEEWNNSFIKFLCDMGERPTGMSLDRINSEKGYYKDNCRWASDKQQLRNTRVNKMLTLNGDTKCLAAWAEEFKIAEGTIARRLKGGWSEEDAVKKPVGTRLIAANQRKFTYKGKTTNIKQWCEDLNLPYGTIHARINRYNWSFEKAIKTPCNTKSQSS